MQQPHALLRCVDPDYRRMCRLAALAVGAGCLAQRADVAEHVQQIVLDLEREPDGAHEAGQRVMQRLE